MKFSTREDIEAPIGKVFEAMTDFRAFERQMQGRGIDIARTQDDAAHAVGLGWKARFAWRGRPHDVAARLVEILDGEGYAIESTSGGVVCLCVVDLVALSLARTRMLISLDLRATTLSSRLLLQSLKLAKGRLDARFKSRVAEVARRIEA